MPFVDIPDEEQRERILVWGSPGAGKSHAILNLAQILSIVDPEATVYIIDADDGLGKIKKASFKSLSNVKWNHIREWPELQEAVSFLSTTVKPHDWIAIDMIGRFWDMAQSYEVTQVYGKTASEFMLVARAEAVSAARLNKPATLPTVDWNVVKKLHNDDFIDKLSSDFPCNLLITTSADPVTDMDDAKAVSLFGQVGFKPDGEKRNAYRVDTLIFIRTMNDGSRVFRTIKDRGRPLLKERKFESLLGDYDKALKEVGLDGVFK